MNNITLAITGSISAYKAADITSALGKLGHQVTVLMTDAAQAFITPLTLQVLSKRPVHTDVMAEDKADSVNHIDLAKETEIFLVAPASADTGGFLPLITNPQYRLCRCEEYFCGAE